MLTPETVVLTPQDDLTSWLKGRTRPLVIKGALANWPSVRVAVNTDSNCEKKRAELNDNIEYLKQFATQQPVFVNESLNHSPRFFYDETLSNKNFAQTPQPFEEFLSHLMTFNETEKNSTYRYMASTSVDYCLPGWATEHPLNLELDNPLISAWLGTPSIAATHFDVPDNLACNVFGRRRFTLFPPEQIANLYIGPIDYTPAGQPVSLVDLTNPDFERFPKFKTALQHAYQVELEPGDALFIPSMWWHNVEALERVNLLINYWWQNVGAHVGQPMDAIKHALLSVKPLSKEQKQAWLTMMEYWLLNDDWEHIPESVRGSLAEMDEKTARYLRAELLKNLNR